MRKMGKKEDTFTTKIIAMRTDETIKRRKWSMEDDEKLISLFFQGIGISYIAIRMHRTEAAVFHRTQKLKLYPKKTKKRAE